MTTDPPIRPAALSMTAQRHALPLAVETLVPHAGNMCVLDRVVDWNHRSIRCEAAIARDCPLLLGGRLPGTALIEYAAQAMAAHGVLLGRDDDGCPEPQRGWLVGLRAVELTQRWIDRDEGPLDVRANRDAGDAHQVIYTFEVRAASGAELATGRATVILDSKPSEVSAPHATLTGSAP